MSLRPFGKIAFAQFWRCGWRSLQSRQFRASPMSGQQDTHPAKKLKMTETKKVIHPSPYPVVAGLTDFPPFFQVIGTHNGTFHCDEALAVYMLRQTSTYADAGMPRRLRSTPRR